MLIHEMLTEREHELPDALEPDESLNVSGWVVRGEVHSHARLWEREIESAFGRGLQRDLTVYLVLEMIHVRVTESAIAAGKYDHCFSYSWPSPVRCLVNDENSV
jgi:hypothetical protein